MSSEKKWYKLVFKQIQPIHIGMGSYGVINETRIFIPGWTMWGALTKAYNLKNGKDLSKNQEKFENISCFWPCFDEKGENVLFPKYKNGEFYLGDYSEEKFRAMFVDTFVSTAVIPGSRMAKDESLHEIDVILPQLKADFVSENNKKQLYWIGIIKIDENISSFLEVGKLKISVGGDIRYGLGQLLLTNKKELTNEENWSSKENIANFVQFRSTNLKAGQIELIAEMDFTRGKPIINEASYYSRVGSKITIEVNIDSLNKGKYI
ncbi:MAG: hypothetical protein PWR24_1771 [Desulfonauticus sp.]|nr:hypothetical protein [Desulfonauticus sp.]